MSSYSELLRHPNWQKKRLYILDLRGWKCQACGEDDKELQVHHLNYIDGHRPWDYPDEWFEVLCVACHEWREKFNAIFGRSAAATVDCRYLTEFFMRHINLPDLAAGKLLAEAARSVTDREKFIAEREFENRCIQTRQWDRLMRFQDPLAYAGSWLTESELNSFETFKERCDALEAKLMEGSTNGEKP